MEFYPETLILIGINGSGATVSNALSGGYMSNSEFKLNPRSLELIERLAKKGKSPDEVMAEIMLGETEEMHPVLYAILEIAKRRKDQGLPSAKQWQGLVLLAKKYAAEWTEPVPLGLRGAMAKELMPYIYPKLSSTSVDAKVDATVKVASVKLSFDLGGEVPKYPDPVEDTGSDEVTLQ